MERIIHYDNGHGKVRDIPESVAKEETRKRVIEFERVRPLLEDYLLKRTGYYVPLQLAGATKVGTCIPDSDIDIYTHLPETYDSDFSEEKGLAIVVAILDLQEGKLNVFDDIKPAYKLHFDAAFVNHF